VDRGDVQASVRKCGTGSGQAAEAQREGRVRVLTVHDRRAACGSGSAPERHADAQLHAVPGAAVRLRLGDEPAP